MVTSWLRAPANCRLVLKFERSRHFDNSVFNPFNPDPSRTVGYGLQTVDEMFNGFVFFVDQHENLQLQVDPDNGQIVSRAAAQ